jgi:hypothetical protein
VGGFGRRISSNLNLFDHVVKVTNSCPQQITVQVCYFESQDCVSVDVPGGETKEAILGTMPSAKEFRFDFTEKF